MSSSSWRSNASQEMLRLRARSLTAIREFFADRKILEVETPALSTAGISDLGLEAMSARDSIDGIVIRYLQTSPEYAMKRLLAAGSGDIYQVCRVFRAAEQGRWHEPEFTLLEWYRLGWNEEQLMTEVESLLHILLHPHLSPATAVRISYREVFRDFLRTDPFEDPNGVRVALSNSGVDVPADIGDDGLLDLALSEVIAPRLNPDTVTFIYDFPANQAALAQIKAETPPVAARFEAFSGGIELANGFAELTDAAEQRRRFEADLAQRRRDGRHEPLLDERFLAALEEGLPPCAGVAVGLDRVLALAAGVSNVAATMSFPHGPGTF
jgi:lysyl-tRNA synthetase class 2